MGRARARQALSIFPAGKTKLFDHVMPHMASDRRMGRAPLRQSNPGLPQVHIDPVDDADRGALLRHGSRPHPSR
jgi:hypothetical protein